MREPEPVTRCAECGSEDIIVRNFTIKSHQGQVDKIRIECRDCGEDEVRILE